jgi:uncharacterized protein
LLESIGAIAIMRTFSSAGQLGKLFYHPDDPFPSSREHNPQQYALDLFYSRLLKVQERLHTDTAKILGKERVEFIHVFLNQLKIELGQIDYTPTGQTPE